MENMYYKALKTFKDEMIEFIEDNWDEMEMAEKNMPDADMFFGYDTSEMSQEEIDDAVSEIQLAYYTTGHCNFDELVAKYLEMKELE